MLGDKQRLEKAIAGAKDDLDFARRLFAQAVEKELIDEAIYRLEAAECRYAYLLKIAKNEFQESGIEE